MLDIKHRHVNQRTITYDIFYKHVKKGVDQGSKCADETYDPHNTEDTQQTCDPNHADDA